MVRISRRLGHGRRLGDVRDVGEGICETGDTFQGALSQVGQQPQKAGGEDCPFEVAVEWARQQIVQEQACPASGGGRVSVQSPQRGQAADTGESGYVTDCVPQECDRCVVVAGLPLGLGGACRRAETAGCLDRRGGEAGYVAGEGLWKGLGASPCEAGAQDARWAVQQQLAGDRGRCHPFEGRYDLGDGVVVEEQEGDGPLMAGAVDALVAVDREVAGECCNLAAEPAADGELGGVRQRERRGLCGIRCVGEDALVELADGPHASRSESG
ncbi:hypothetical protein [Streptomyces spongiae]|uniref:Uncharacterized protein n=1 Tax=Streptomyces spongiae TaxID=565072 RepID=A0A5N8X9B4_9ACTN|nr:hypothetical protein [Streptomyces spongiae]MPY56022.1 hypothetical protein [Streptomyces spongiae]